MLALQLNIFMVILLAGIAVHVYFKLDKKEYSHRLFFVLILLTILILVLEVLSVALNSGNYTGLITAHRLVDTLGFGLCPLVPITAVLYVYKRVNKYKKINSAKLLWFSVPFVVNAVVSAGSYNHGWIFTIGDDNVYARGPLFFVSPVTIYFYYLANLLVIYDGRKHLNKEELLVLSLLTAIPAVMSVFQLYYFIYLTIWNSTAIAVIINYISLVHSQTKLDPLTGLGNRLAYNEYLADLRSKSNIVLSVLTIDLDDFKGINDAYGHHEGDKVLRFFARQLETVFAGKGVAIRLGGDEFTVLINENDREVLQEQIKALHDNIDADSARTDALMPYQVKFSYGVTVFDNAYKNIDELIQHSDKLMYERKQQKNCAPA